MHFRRVQARFVTSAQSGELPASTIGAKIAPVSAECISRLKFAFAVPPPQALAHEGKLITVVKTYTIAAIRVQGVRLASFDR